LAKKRVITEAPKPVVEQPKAEIYTIRKLNCIVDGVEQKFKKIKSILEEETINEIQIFGISNKLYKELTEYLKQTDRKHVIYGRSRIGLY
jgi:hypothetical protein